MERSLLRHEIMKSKVLSFLKKIYLNLDSVLLTVAILLINLDLCFTIISKSSIASLCFKSSFVVIVILFINRLFQTIKHSTTFKDFFKADFIKHFIIAIIPIVVTGIIVLVPLLTKQASFGDYLTKYVCLSFVFILLILLVTVKFNKFVPRICTVFSFFVGVLFLVATVIPNLRGRTFTGAFTFNFSNPNAASLAICYTICSLIYGVFISKSLFSKFVYGAEICGLLVAMYFTQARAPFIALIVGGIFAYIIIRLRKRNSLIISASVISFILFFACVYVLIIYSVSGGQSVDFVSVPGLGKGLTTRYGMWVEGFKRITEQPLKGYYFIFNGQLQYHNGILDLFVAYGIPCAVIIICCFIYLISKALDNLKFVSVSQKVALFCFLSLIFTGLFESTIFSSPQGMYILFFSFIAYFKIPLCTDSVAESNAISFGKETNKKVDLILINSVYKKGSTGKIVESIKSEIEKDGYSAFVLYGRKEIDIPEYNVALCTSQAESLICRLLNKVTKDYSLLNYFSTFEYIRIIRKYKPQVVHIHCLNDHYINQYLLFRYLKRKHIKTVLTLHSENLYVGCQEGHVFDCSNWCDGNKCRNCKKYKNACMNKRTWNRLNKMFTNFDELTITTVSPWLASRAQKSTILKNFDIKVVLNGVNSNFTYREERSGLLPGELDNKKKILFVCANAANSHKGFEYFKLLAKKFESNKSVHFICLSLENYIGNKNKNITYLEPIRDNVVLSKLYSECDLSLVLSHRETFSMPTAESLSCGTMVAGFKCGGAESISDEPYATFVDYGDLDSLRKTIEKKVFKNVNKQEASSKHKELYSSRRMYSDFSSIYNMEKKNITINIKI